MKTTKIILSALGATFFYFFAKYYIAHTTEPGFQEAIFLAGIMAFGSFIHNLWELTDPERGRNSKRAFVRVICAGLFGFISALLLIHETSLPAFLGIVALSIALSWINQVITGN